jgi:hypothetical protein
MGHGKGRKANKGHIGLVVKKYYSKPSSTVVAHIAGPLSRNNPGATTEVATARMICHLKHCQTPSKIINGLTLLRASKSPAEHVGRLVYNKKSSLHRFT